uniref:Uncharacterized protein n=1 Tax=Rhodothermus marinus TaxID=29549 RepID=A0A7V2AZW2_RHOMR
MKALRSIVPILALLAAFLLGRQTAPIRTVERVRTDTIYAERLLPAETVRVAVPVERVIYRERVRVRTDTVRVPVEVERYVISRPEPIRTEPGRCVWTYFEPSVGRWEQAVYSVPPQAAGYSLHAALGRMLVADTWRWYAAVESEARYRRLGAFLRASTIGLSAGVRVRVWP